MLVLVSRLALWQWNTVVANRRLSYVASARFKNGYARRGNENPAQRDPARHEGASRVTSSSSSLYFSLLCFVDSASAVRAKQLSLAYDRLLVLLDSTLGTFNDPMQALENFLEEMSTKDPLLMRQPRSFKLTAISCDQRRCIGTRECRKPATRADSKNSVAPLVCSPVRQHTVAAL